MRLSGEMRNISRHPSEYFIESLELLSPKYLTKFRKSLNILKSIKYYAKCDDGIIQSKWGHMNLVYIINHLPLHTHPDVTLVLCGHWEHETVWISAAVIMILIMKKQALQSSHELLRRKIQKETFRNHGTFWKLWNLLELSGTIRNNL